MEKSWSGNLHTADRSERNAALVSALLATNTQRKNKSVRFESETDLATYGSSSDNRHMKEKAKTFKAKIPTEKQTHHFQEKSY